MLAFTQHPYMLLSSKALPLWIVLLSPRDNAAKQESQPPKPSHSLLPLECVSALLDLAGIVHLDSLAACHAGGSLALLYISETHSKQWNSYQPMLIWLKSVHYTGRSMKQHASQRCRWLLGCCAMLCTHGASGHSCGRLLETAWTPL